MNRAAWILRMAWRDSRASRGKLLLAGAAMLAGVAALVALASFRDNLRAAIGTESKSVLGADVAVQARERLDADQRALIGRLGGETARELGFSSMAAFPDTGDTRLVLVRGLDGGFPFYGEFRTEPADARAQLAAGRHAIVEQSLLLQFGRRVGDTIRLGATEFTIVAALLKAPGEADALGSVAPRVFIPYGEVEGTGLLRAGSFVREKVYVRLPDGVDAAAALEPLRPELRAARLRVETVESRQEQLGRILDRVYAFLNVSGLIALLLGAVGVASAMQAYIRPKMASVATLRCLGAPTGAAFAIYLLQALVTGVIGAAGGAAVGTAVQYALPVLLGTFLPFDVAVRASWPAIAEGLAVGTVVCVTFALLPLLRVRRISPLRALRSVTEADESGRDPLRWVAVALLVAGVVGGAVWQVGRVDWGLGIAAGAGVAVAALYGLARGLIWLVRRSPARGLPYAWRQGLSNLHRPGNRTVLLVSALGLGTFLILTLFLVRGALLADIQASSSTGRPNLIVWDVQPDERASVEALFTANGVETASSAAMVTMRIASIGGVSAGELMNRRGDDRLPPWRLRHEYRSIHRAELNSRETIVSGEWIPRWDGAGAVPVSVEEEVARDLRLGVGDVLAFDVQGVEVPVRVASVRRVDWGGFDLNSFLLFPEGVLEDAPQMVVLAGRAPGVEAAARLQRALGREHPGVSILDLRLVQETVDGVLRQVGWVVQFMALFTVATGLLVLAGAVLAGRFERAREAALLRTLGARRATVETIQLAEYAFLGATAAALGSGLAWGAAWAFGRFVLELDALPPWTPLLVAWAIIAGLAVAAGWLGSRGLLRQPPLVVLRAEG